MKHLVYDETRNLYKATSSADTGKSSTTWFVVREPGTHKIVRDSVAANTAVAEYNSGNPRSRKTKSVFRHNVELDRFKQYEANLLYYRGVYSLKNGAYDSAHALFNKALEKNADLAYYSDIHYLQGVALTEMHDSSGGQEKFERFIHLSEQIYPPVFGVRFHQPPEQYGIILKSIATNNHTTWNSRHFTNEFDPKFNAPTYMPGFRFVPSDHLGSVSVGVLFTDTTGMGGVLKTTLNLKYGFFPYTAITSSKEYTKCAMGIHYPLFRNRTNTLGAETCGELSVQRWNALSDSVENSYLPQYVQTFEMSWYPILRTGVFWGYNVPLFNQYLKYARYENDNLLLWQNTSVFAGINYHILNDIGVTARYENRRFILGLFMGELVGGIGKGNPYVNILNSY